MSDPLALFPIAVAAGHGVIDDMPATQLVAAGLTLLQRSAGLVRALYGRRSAILLPPGPAFFTALAASDGRGAVLLDPLVGAAEIAWQLSDGNVGAVFTDQSLSTLLPTDIPLVLLDDAPRTAGVVIDGATRRVDLGTHHGFAVSGSTTVAGLDEECLVTYTMDDGRRSRDARFSHRHLIASARSSIIEMGLTPDDHSLSLSPWTHPLSVIVGAAAPLMCGGRVTTVQLGARARR